MLKKKTVTTLFLLLFTAGALYSAQNPFPLPPSALTSSYSEGSFSSMLNPVFSDLDNADDFAYRYQSYGTENAGNHYALINVFGFDLVYSSYNAIPVKTGESVIDGGVTLYSINRGFLFDNTFGFGAGYSFAGGSDGYYSRYRGWSAGFLLRPAEFLSLGISFRDINGEIGGERIDPTADYSVSVRPWKDYLTLSAGFLKQKNFDPEYYCAAELKGYKDISLSVKYGTDKSVTAGLTIPLFLRSGNGLGIIMDAYGSDRSESADFKSTGISLKVRRNNNAVHIAPSENFITLNISGNYNLERDKADLFTRREPTFQDLVTGLERAADDKTITGIFMEINNSEFGFAQIQEIRDLLNTMRSRGKKVYAVLNYSGNSEYYLAAASDRIFFTPNSTFKITGLSAKVYFLKGLMDKGGVKFEAFSKGKYKSFSESFTRKDMSEYARENLRAILNDLNEQFISAVIEDRDITRSAVEEHFSRGLYTPAEAKEKGFVDEVMYAAEALETVRGKGQTIPFENYIREESVTAAWGKTPAIAVINVTGSIVSGQGGSSMSDSTGDFEYSRAIETAFGDPSVKAVVIRIDSGGGSAAASDFMWSALHTAKKNNPKPVVFSFGNTAASGGYYIACTGDTIFAGKGTITGSIGVVAGKVSAEGLYAKLGISTETIRMSEFADIFSESRSLTENDKALFQKEIDFIYDRFTGKVMEGRQISPEEISAVAEGRIHTGAASKGNKLINETGGITAAIEYARVKGNIDSDYRIINLPENVSILKGIFSDSSTVALFKEMKFLIRNIEKYRLLDEQTLYIQPYTVEIE